MLKFPIRDLYDAYRDDVERRCLSGEISAEKSWNCGEYPGIFQTGREIYPAIFEKSNSH